MKRDEERIQRNKQALKDANLDTVVCALPMNVLLLTGYYPVIGTSLAVFASDGSVILLVPQDERELAEAGWADEVRTFSTGSLCELMSVTESVEKPLAEIAEKLKIRRRRIGFESGIVSEPVNYAAMNLYGAGIKALLRHAFPRSEFLPAGETLTRLRSVLTTVEIERVKTACKIAARAFTIGASQLSAGLRETEIAAEFRRALSVCGNEFDSINRADGYAFCMSGENSFEAFAAYQRSRSRRLRHGDFAMVHCNSYADGFWTDITRTFCVGDPDERKGRMYEAVFAARQAAMSAIYPGVYASEIDRAAREILVEKGFGKEFKHGLGHGVGFHAIDHNAPPRLHPASPDRLETGTVFNVEPAIYIEKYGGLRHCDMIAVTENGAENLTPFQSCVESLIVCPQP